MAVMIDPCNGFDFAYKGFQYPLPPSWKRAVRLEDQIQWLLQALLKVACDSATDEEIATEVGRVKEWVSAQLGELAGEIDAVAAGRSWVYSPVDGEFVTAQVALRQVYDMARYYGLTYEELAETGKTYEELAADGLPYYALDQFGNLHYGNGQMRAKHTPPEDIADALGTPPASDGSSSGYVLPTATATRLGGVKIGSGINVSADGTISVQQSGGGAPGYVTGRTYGELATYGFVQDRG